MKVIKPQQLGVVTRCYEWKRGFQLGISALAFVPMSTAERRLIPELAMWPAVSEQMDGSPVLDAGIPKAKAEYLVVGSVHTPGGKPTAQCTAMVEVAGRRKLLHVSGDRQWRSPVAASQPSLFTSMPLSWSRAFGGPAFAENPPGCGFQPESGPTAESRRLPNLEYAASPVRTATDRVPPAGFGPLDITWPQRTKLAGTHDDHWLRTDFPGFPRDIDWEFFNLAPPDQRFGASFEHDAPYILHNLHPDHPQLAGRLPSIRARCFVQRAGRDLVAFSDLEEVSLRLTTLWFFPAIQRIVLIFQGQVRVQEDDASDLTHVLAAVEDTSASRGVEHYREVVARRCDRKTSHLYALKDSELCPAELTERDPKAEEMQAAASQQGLAAARLKRRMHRELEAARARVVALGFDPDLHAPPLPPEEAPPPDIEQLPEVLAQLEAEAEREQEKARAEQAARDAELERLFAELGLSFDEVKGEREHAAVGPPSFTVEGKIAELRRLMAIFEARGLPTDHVQEIIDDPEMRKTWEHGELKGREAYRLTAHLQRPAPADDAAKSEQIRRSVQERLASGAGFAGIDLTGADLSGLTLDGANFEGAFLEHVNLNGASARGANFRNAVLAHAEASECKFAEADLRGCNLGAGRYVAADFSGAQLEHAILARADLTRARFGGARLEATDLTGAELREASFAAAALERVTISEASLCGADFSAARVLGCHLLKVDLEGASFRGATLTGTLLLECKGKVDFRQARLHNVRMVESCVFDGSVFARADLSDAYLRGTSLQAADLRRAKLERADLSRARLDGADLRVVEARGASLSRAQLAGAKLAGANLRDANLSSARLEGADLSFANLSGADLSRVRIDTETRYDSVLAIRTRVYPQHQPHELVASKRGKLDA